MFRHKIEELLSKTVRDLGFVGTTDTVLSIPEKSQFGDYSSNIALQLSKQKHQNSYQNPREIANAIIEKLGHPKFLERVEAAGPGFLNFFIKDEEIVKILGKEEDTDALLDQEDLKRIIVEYCDPNTHKMLHIGHLLQLTLGEAMSRLYEYQGHEVYRTNYGSDIGLTVAKCLYGIVKLKEKYEQVKQGSLKDKAQFLGEAYAFAHGEYEKSLEAKEKIDQITNKLYSRESEVLPLWEETKDWSLGYFELIYATFGTLFDRRINESEVDQLGKEVVLENVGKVFKKDQGAIIFPGEKYNLHNRVFINSKNNPTYEGKEVGLAEKYIELYQFDKINIFSHKEQDDYFKVVIAANAMIFPELRGKVNHISYGEVKLPSGKMSSRTGNIVSAEDILEEVKAKIKGVSGELDDLNIQKLAVAAIKFAFLKYSPASDIVYDLEESVSIHGDTGPYVMYVFARIQSLLRKAGGVSLENRASLRQGYGLQASEDFEADENETEGIAQEVRKDSEILGDQKTGKSEIRNSGKSGSPSSSEFSGKQTDLEVEERELLRQLEYFEFTASKAADNFQPNEIVKYLLGLTKAFNSFYEKHHIVGSKKADFRLLLSRRVAEQIKLGLYLLGIETVERM